jgi:nicotinamidase-related amidase
VLSSESLVQSVPSRSIIPWHYVIARHREEQDHCSESSDQRNASDVISLHGKLSIYAESFQPECVLAPKGGIAGHCREHAARLGTRSTAGKWEKQWSRGRGFVDRSTTARWRYLTGCAITPRLAAVTAFIMQKQSHRLTRARAGLVVVDIQERLVPAIFEKERVVQNALRLVQGAAILQVPIFATEQYRKGLGLTVPEVSAAIPGFAPMEKLAFSACGASGFVPALESKQVSDAVLCGIEAHVCVTQTCLDLLDKGFRVFVAADAVSSRTPENYRIGLERMRAAGAVIVSTEMVLFELLGRAGTAEFKQVLTLVK